MNTREISAAHFTFAGSCDSFVFLMNSVSPPIFGGSQQIPSLSSAHHPPEQRQRTFGLFKVNMARETKVPHGFISVEEFIRTRDSGKLLSSIAILSLSQSRMDSFFCFASRRVPAYTRYRRHVSCPAPHRLAPRCH